MKYCDTCHTTYPNEFTACPKDQAPLRETAEMIEGMVIREKYQIVRKIGSGKMATVYQAKHLTFNETRALKVLENRLAKDEAFLNRFKQEAVTRKLAHENIVRVEDFDFAEDDSPFLVMEYVEGRPLRSLMVEGPVPAPRAAAIAAQIAAALSAAHKAGVVHRDLKPENVMLATGADGHDLVKVLEFGMAKVREASTDLLPGYATMTKTATVVGTPSYLSPEQAMGKKGDDVDARADIYSLGVTMYEMLTGKAPFESATAVGMLVQHITATPKAPHESNPSVPQALSDVVLKAMAKDRNARYQNADEMMEAITKAQPAEGQKPAAAGAGTRPTPKPGTVMIKFETPKAPKASIAETKHPTPAPGGATAVKTPPPMATPRLRTGGAAAAPAPAHEAVDGGKRPTPTGPTKAPSFSAVDEVNKPGSPLPLMIGGAVAVLLVIVGLVLHFKKPAPVAQNTTASVRNETAGDPKLLIDVQQLLATSPTFNNVNATVEKGVVTLSGLVSQQSDSDRAANIVKNLAGVKDVKNQVEVNAKKVARLETANAASAQPAPAPARRAATTTTTAAATPAPAPEAPANPAQLRARAMIALGNRQVDAGDYQSAINAFQSAQILDPGNPGAEAGLRRANEAMRNAH